MIDRQVSTQTLECLDDLDLLIPGDTITLVIQTFWNFRTTSKETKAAYHQRSPNGPLEFIIPHWAVSTGIVMYKAQKNLIEIKEGKVILRENSYQTDSFTERHYHYPQLNRTLIMAGLR